MCIDVQVRNDLYAIQCYILSVVHVCEVRCLAMDPSACTCTS